jgi:uncharacterized protein (DUF2141 family)
MRLRILGLCAALSLTGAFGGSSMADTPRGASLRIVVSGVRNTSGLLRVSLFRSADGYPEDSTKAVRTLSVPVSDQANELHLASVPPGTWALAVLHDENRNGKLDKNFVGIPTEGVGASNGAASRLGPPKFEDARFLVGESDLRLGIQLVYWL